jgi:hypothetical protein
MTLCTFSVGAYRYTPSWWAAWLRLCKWSSGKRAYIDTPLQIAARSRKSKLVGLQRFDELRPQDEVGEAVIGVAEVVEVGAVFGDRGDDCLGHGGVGVVDLLGPGG